MIIIPSELLQAWYNYLIKRRVVVARITAIKWPKLIGIIFLKLILATVIDKCNVTIADTNMGTLE